MSKNIFISTLIGVMFLMSCKNDKRRCDCTYNEGNSSDNTVYSNDIDENYCMDKETELKDSGYSDAVCISSKG